MVKNVYSIYIIKLNYLDNSFKRQDIFNIFKVVKLQRRIFFFNVIVAAEDNS